MTDSLDVVCKGGRITGPAYDPFDVLCKGTIGTGPRRAAASGTGAGR
jgi:hypothetical protein